MTSRKTKMPTRKLHEKSAKLSLVLHLEIIDPEESRKHLNFTDRYHALAGIKYLPKQDTAKMCYSYFERTSTISRHLLRTN